MAKSWASGLCALCLFATGCAAEVDEGPGPSGDVDPSLIDNPIDEFGYSIVGEDIYPPLYQRVEAKCVPLVSGKPEVCSTDDDCGQGFACLCGHEYANRCVPAECRSTADCNGGKCLVSRGAADDECCDRGHLGLVCSRSESTCQHGGDCPGNGIACIYDERLDFFECKPVSCSCGS
jgi:hypothetical protein